MLRKWQKGADDGEEGNLWGDPAASRRAGTGERGGWAHRVDGEAEVDISKTLRRQGEQGLETD